MVCKMGLGQAEQTCTFYVICFFEYPILQSPPKSAAAGSFERLLILILSAVYIVAVHVNCSLVSAHLYFRTWPHYGLPSQHKILKPILSKDTHSQPATSAPLEVPPELKKGCFSLVLGNRFKKYTVFMWPLDVCILKVWFNTHFILVSSSYS